MSKTRELVEKWFEAYGSDSSLEIESRIKGGVSSSVFQYVLRKLGEANCWEAPVREVETWDVVFTGSSRVRATYSLNYSDEKTDGSGVGGGGGGGGGGASRTCVVSGPTYLRKEKEEDPFDFEHLDKATGLHLPVRISCHCEIPLESVKAGLVVQHARYKKRHSFNRKNEFQYDLTEVRSGSTVEEARASRSVEYEIELEWIGQKAAKEGRYAALGGAKHLAEKYLLKVQDICGLVAAALKAEAASAKE